MLKIKNCIQNTLFPSGLTANMWLDLNETEYEFVEDGPVDIVLWTHPVRYEDIIGIDATIYIHLDLHHATNNKIVGWNNLGWTHHSPQNYVILECTDPTINNPRILSNLFIFNRSKAYYSNRKFKNDSHRWYYRDSGDFELQPMSSANDKTCVYLSPSKPSRSDLIYRIKLIELLDKKYPKVGYLGNLVGSFKSSGDHTFSEKGLCSNGFSPHATKVVDITYENNSTKAWLGFYAPVHNAYYNETFISVYGETLEIGTTQLVTEKTYDPLIKGHFILPFSTSGFIDLVKSQGFRLPKFINYEYDLISDPDQRWQAYQQELDRLLNLSMDKWRQHWVDNLDILHYNRNQLYERDYDRVDLKKLLEAQE